MTDSTSRHRERDFRVRLAVASFTPVRRFAPITAGAFLVSVQASRAHASRPRAEVAVHEVEAWEVAIREPGGRWVTPRTHPDLFASPWNTRWAYSVSGLSATGQYVPTSEVQALLEHLEASRDRTTTH